MEEKRWEKALRTIGLFEKGTRQRFSKYQAMELIEQSTIHPLVSSKMRLKIKLDDKEFTLSDECLVVFLYLGEVSNETLCNLR